MPSGRAVVTSGSLRVGYLILALYSILGIASIGLSSALTLGLSAVAQVWRGSSRGATWITDLPLSPIGRDVVALAKLLIQNKIFVSVQSQIRLPI